MSVLNHLFANNQAWAMAIKRDDPGFFQNLEGQQAPDYLWIGCADSRVPANQIIGLPPGEVFVHRNVANLVIHTDFNCLSCIQYAVEILHVKHIILCGHYGCGGVKAAMQDNQLGLIDNWLRHVKDVYQKHEVALCAIADETERLDRLCELNVAEQVRNVCHTTTVRRAWQQGQPLTIHGWIYSLHDGLLRDLQIGIDKPEAIDFLSEEK